MKKFSKALILLLMVILTVSFCACGNKAGQDNAQTASISITEVTETPEAADEPVLTEEPGETDEPVLTEEPEATDEPAVTEEPEAANAPEATEAPAVTEEPEEASAPETTGAPAVTEEPEATEAPAVTEEPAVTEAASDEITVTEDGEYSDKEHVALYLHTYGHLPSNYITKNEAKAAGWDSGAGNLITVLPGKSIGGDRFGNYEGLLPDAKGRKYYECDINFNPDGKTSGRVTRGPERIIFSSDGLIFYTADHYNSFEQLY